MGFTFAEKALARAAGLTYTVAGQIVDTRPDVALSHDNTAPIARTFREIGARRVRFPRAAGHHPGSRRPRANHTARAKSRRNPPLRRGTGDRTLLRGGPRYLPPGDQRRGAGLARTTDPRFRQPHDALRLAGCVRRRGRPQRDGGDLGDGRAVVTRARDDPHRPRRRAAAGGHGQGSEPVGAPPARAGRRHLHGPRIRRPGPGVAEPRKPHGHPEHDGRGRREERVPGTGRRGIRLAGGKTSGSFAGRCVRSCVSRFQPASTCLRRRFQPPVHRDPSRRRRALPRP